VPLLRSDDILGVLVLHRAQMLPFTEKQIALVETFAHQAVIAIENARLFIELTETLEQQRTTGDILQAISNSPGDAQLVLSTIAASAARLLYVTDAEIMTLEGDVLRLIAKHGSSLQWSVGTVRTINRNWVTGRAIIDRITVHVPDLQAAEAEFPEGAAYAKQFGHRTTLATPLLREGNPMGAILIRRMEVRPFNEKQIALVQNFAAQAMIAVENTRLFEAEQERTRELARSLGALRAAQDRLVQTEKLASLGQLTAGIAHEIKNPLNFVNNFAALSAELTDELKDILKPAVLDETIRAEVDEITGMLKDNLTKVVQHGNRADAIVKNMLLHSRDGSGEHRSADINALVAESLNLAYHGARAEKSGFAITLRSDFDPDAGAAELYPQEFTRALLNLISNGFYAAIKRKVEFGDESFEPVLSASTRNLGKTVEIRIRDNGTGIPPGVKEEIFVPFFTTKPTGEGTGLGLSISHDIIVKQHGGSIDVESEPGLFTEFKIVLPRAGQR
jgi:signal transduction histidine kinase